MLQESILKEGNPADRKRRETTEVPEKQDWLFKTGRRQH